MITTETIHRLASRDKPERFASWLYTVVGNYQMRSDVDAHKHESFYVCFCIQHRHKLPDTHTFCMQITTLSRLQQVFGAY